MKTLKEILTNIIEEVKQMEIKPVQKNRMYYSIGTAVCTKLKEITGYDCCGAKNQRDTDSIREIIIFKNQKVKQSLFYQVKLIKSHVEGSYLDRHNCYKIKDIILVNEEVFDYNRTIEEVFEVIEKFHAEREQEQINKLPKVISKINRFIGDIQTKMNNSEKVNINDIQSDLKNLVKEYNECLEAKKNVG